MTVVKFKMKSLFFDTKKVEHLIGKRSAKAMSEAGAHVRTRARQQLRRRKSISKPGNTPSVHSQDDTASLRNIWFALDERTLTVVAGPLALNQVNFTTDGGRTTVPELHEFGGAVSIHEQQFKVKLGRTVSPSQIREAMNQPWRRADLRRAKRPWLRYRVRQAQYPARPFMWPALQHEAPKFPQLWFKTSGGFSRAA